MTLWRKVWNTTVSRAISRQEVIVKFRENDRSWREKLSMQEFSRILLKMREPPAESGRVDMYVVGWYWLASSIFYMSSMFIVILKSTMHIWEIALHSALMGTKLQELANISCTFQTSLVKMYEPTTSLVQMNKAPGLPSGESTTC